MNKLLQITIEEQIIWNYQINESIYYHFLKSVNDFTILVNRAISKSLASIKFS